MARIVVSKHDVHLVLSLRERAALFGNGKWRTEAARGVTDAGRRVKTQVQRAVRDQMGLKPGHYQSYVVSGTKGVPRQSQLAFEIYGLPGGSSRDLVI